MTTADSDQPFSPLVADILTAQSEYTAGVANAVIDGLQKEVSELTATLAAVREDVGALIYGRWMPTTAAIDAALWPSKERIDQLREVGR